MVIALAYLAVDYNRQQKRQAAYNFQIESSIYSLSVLPEPPPDLDKQLAEIDAAGEAALEALSASSVNSTEVINTLMTLADACSLQVTPVTTDSWLNRQVGGHNYEILPVKFQVQGSMPSLIEYIKSIEQPQQYPYLVIAEIDVLNNPEARADGDQLNPLISAKLVVNIIIRLPPEVEETQ